MGVKLPEAVPTDKLQRALERRKVSVSYRGDFVRVSPSVYNTTADMALFVEGVREASIG